MGQGNADGPLEVYPPGSAAYSPSVGRLKGWCLELAPVQQLGGFVLLTREQQVLLVKQAYGLGLWALPGGLASPGESVEAAAIREANEETGLDVELGGVVGIADRGSVVLVVFAGSVRGGQLRAEPGEIEEVRWFNNEELLVMGDAFALARALASAAVEGSIGRGLVSGSVVGPDGGGHSVFWSML